MYRLNSLNADIQLIVDGAWESFSHGGKKQRYRIETTIGPELTDNR